MTKNPNEEKLLHRLRNVGLILLFFSLTAFTYSFFQEEFENIEASLVLEEDLLTNFEQLPPLNMYLVSSVFCAVGTICLITARKKGKVDEAVCTDR